MAKKNTQQKKALTADLSILKNPRITEKAAKNADFSIYVFDVAATATKAEIAKAFMGVYKHAPVKINTVTQRPVSHFRGGVLGFGKRGKKAYVFLPKGTKIDII